VSASLVHFQTFFGHGNGSNGSNDSHGTGDSIRKSFHLACFYETAVEGRMAEGGGRREEGGLAGGGVWR
jgi:hypothetical protein